MPQQSPELKSLIKVATHLYQNVPSKPDLTNQLKSQLSDHFGIQLEDPKQAQGLKLVILLFIRYKTFRDSLPSLVNSIFSHEELRDVSVFHHSDANKSPLFSSSYLASFDDMNQLQSDMKGLVCFSALRCLTSIDEHLRTLCVNEVEEKGEPIPIFGSKDSQTIHGLGDMLSNWGIYHLLAMERNPLAYCIGQPRSEMIQAEPKPASSLLSIIRQLVAIVLPNDSKSSDLLSDVGPSDRSIPGQLTNVLDPRFSLQRMLLPCMFVPLVAGLIKHKLDPMSCVSEWAERNLENLLDQAYPQKVFACLLSLSSCPSRKSIPTRSAIEFRREVSKILSSRLLEPSGVRGFLQAVMVDDYEEDDDTGSSMPSENKSTIKPHSTFHSTSATLNRLNSIAHILCNPPQSSDPVKYLNHLVSSLLQVISPDFLFYQSNGALENPHSSKSSDFKNNHPRPSGVTKAACHVLSQIIVKQPNFFRSHLGPMLHSVFIPFQARQHTHPAHSSNSDECSDDDFDPIAVTANQISQSINLLTTLVLNSNPSDVLISALILPILPQILSLWLYLCQSRSEPQLREEINDLVSVWVKMCPIQYVGETIKRCIRELEIGRELNLTHVEGRGGWRYWSRDAEGQSCIRITRDADAIGTSEDLSTIKPDPDYLIDWLAGLKNDKLNSNMLVNWLDELESLRHREGLAEAKMTLFRMQMVLKMIEKLDSSVVQEPVQILEFVKHSFSSLSETHSHGTSFTTISSRNEIPDKCPTDDASNISTSLNFLKMGENETLDILEKEDTEDAEEADNSLILTGLTLLLTVLEANPSLDERSAASLKVISEKLDYIILRCSNVRPEVNELSLKCRIMLSVRNALAQVDQSIDTTHNSVDQSSDHHQTRRTILSTYEEGLKLVEDPCLPIRAQGITILKKLFSGYTKTIENTKLMSELVPNVLDVLLKLIEEEDSFIYLNAIKAISELAEQFSHLICLKLNKLYAFNELFQTIKKDSQFTEDEQPNKELDKRLRIGEAMVQIVQRAGQALPNYQTSIIAMLPYLSDLMDSCLIILSLESRPTLASSTAKSAMDGVDSEKQEITKTTLPELIETPDSENQSKSTDPKRRVPEETILPVSKDSGHPALRRSAIMFLLITLSLNVDQLDRLWRQEYLTKTIRVLEYVKLVDPDGLVQHQANAAVENLTDMG
ncbi:uncharacterized protein MELLADRAFT_63613 [Melampsora larici-populina 98AG31]|uniref:RNA polymerase II assembly factor Rtp1 C-terminal domain-containing protein n=1 Tax=Melampsora larici-populina (strain 98AG31 / pathotype 3-4-7) TaxID=747676 RepID=F4RNB3_MELLP|nr:uncharacterized protein MELLADRAFT_63613 [Melampsora larici-populina 98AG31]EGG06127.1 hypothetical protein MELLADRAFT_63613 [Melampsora larici-populina 98AG31]